MKPSQPCLVYVAVFAFWIIFGCPRAQAQNRPIGTDVSSYQGAGINWTTVKHDGVSFVWAKATEGTYDVDADFFINQANARAAGVYIGAYHYARPSDDPNITGANSADTEARYFWAAAGNYVVAGGGSLVPMLDWEDVYVTNVPSLTETTLSQWVNEWCNDVSNYARANGVIIKPVVYTGTWFSEPGAYPGLNTSVNIWPSWLASYPSCTDVSGTEECGSATPQTSSPPSTYPWSTWNLWQYGDTNWSGGDADVFNGTTNQFVQMFVVPGTNLFTIPTNYWDPGSLHASPGSGGSGSWNDSAVNWWPGGASDAAYSPNGVNTVFAGTAGTVTLTALEAASSLTFNTGGYTIAGSGQTLIMNSAAAFNIVSSGTASVQCILGGEGYTVTGGGTLLLNNSANFSDGETVIGPGTVLEVATDHDSGNDGVTLNLSKGGTYQDDDATSGDQFLLSGSAIALGSGGGILSDPNGSLTMANFITGSGSLTFTGGSGFTLTLTDTANNYSGGTIVAGPGTLKANAAGTLGSTSGALTVSGGILNLGSASYSVGSVTISGGTIQTGTLTGTSYAGQSGTVSAVLAGTHSLTKTTTGTLTLSGANTYTGINSISGGLLQISADNNLGAVPGSPIANSVTLANGGISTGLRCTASFALSANRGITLSAPNGGSIQATQGKTVTYGGVITGGGSLGLGSSYMLGYGVMVLSGANTYTGATTIAAGTLQLGANGTLPSGTPLLIGADGNTGGGSILDLNGFSQTIGALASSTGIGGTGTDTPTIKLTGALTILQNSNTIFAGVISGSGGSLTLNGSGTLTLNGVNTYTGATTLSAGTLALASGSSITSTASINIGAGATFDVSAIGSYVMGGGTTLSASGTANPATINGGSSVNLGARPIVLTYDGAHPALVIAQGSLSLNGNPFTVNGSPLPIGTYTVIQQTTGSISSSGSFSVAGNAIGSGTAGSISISGGNVVLTIVDSTATSLGSLTPSTYGQLVTLTANVVPAPAGGTVQFYDNGLALGGPIAVNTGMAAYATTLFTAGSHPITASYGGTAGYAASSTAGASTQQVNAAPLNVTANPQSKVYGAGLSFGSGSTNFTSSGLQNSNTIGSVTLAVSGNGGAAGAPVGNYTITPSAAAGGTFSPGNYSIAYNPGTLTVTLPSNTIAVTISGITTLANGAVQMNFSGTPGYVYWVEAATNLFAPVDWMIISTNAADTNGNFSFTDLNATSYSQRFYRTAAQ